MPRTPTSDTTKSRRSHRKSRNGCAECKRRHMRCDETRPTCRNCTTAERACAYPNPKLFYPGQAAGTAGGGGGGGQGASEGAVALAKRPLGERNGAGEGLSPAGASGGASPYEGVGSESNEVMGARRNGSRLGEGFDHRDGQGQARGGGWATHRDSLSAPPRPISAPILHTSTPTLPSFHEGFMNSPSATPPIPSIGNCIPSTTTTSPHLPPQPACYTPQHLALLHHVGVVMQDDFLTGEWSTRVVSMAVREAARHPYLIDQLLALSAMHLAHEHPESAHYYRHEATELQTRALSSFAREPEAQPEAEAAMDKADAMAVVIPRFLFAGSLNLHVLADSLTYYRHDFAVFAERLGSCLKLHRGIRAVPPNWKDLYNSELHPLLNVTHEAEKRMSTAGRECDALSRLIDDCDQPHHHQLSATNVRAYRQAVDRLQHCFHIITGMDEPRKPNAIMTFAALVSIEYIDLLQDLQPLAIAILGYLGVLIHRCRGYWVFGDSGAWLVRTVAQRLGDFGAEVMRWPLEVIQT